MQTQLYQRYPLMSSMYDFVGLSCEGITLLVIEYIECFYMAKHMTSCFKLILHCRCYHDGHRGSQPCSNYQHS